MQRKVTATRGVRVAERGAVRFCVYCGAVGAAHLGPCSVCGQRVCEKCGNIQHIKGECKPIHDACLKDSGDSFSMIKFVK